MAETSSIHDQARIRRLLTALISRPKRVLLVTGLLTAAFLVLGIATAPDKEASFSPGGEVFSTAEHVERTFRATTTELQFIVEDKGSDALDLASLREWKRNSDALRADNELSPAFSTYYDKDLGRTVVGFYTIADAVDDELHGSGVAGGLGKATEGQVKIALGRVLAVKRPTAVFRDALSVHAVSSRERVGGTQITQWTSPAFLTSVRVDHSAFPVDLETKSDPATRTDTQQAAIDDARDVEIEHWGRDALSALRGEQQNLNVWGIAIDKTLTSDESFNATVPYLLGAFALIVLLIGGVFRSYWALTLAGVGIAVTLLWARMITNIIGFHESIILDVIVPIATISFGVDFLIHAVSRVREELTTGARHRSAYVVGIANIAGALALALSTSAIALASNAASSIQAVTEFGFGAAIALASAFVVLGVLAPLFLLRIEEVSGAESPAATGGVFRRALRWLRLVAAAVLAALVIIGIIAAPFVGAIGTVAYALLFIALPTWRLRRRTKGARAAAPAVQANTAGESSVLAGRLISSIVRVRYAMFAVMAIVTIAAAIGATHVGRQTEPRDFYPSDSDFIVGIDKLVAHTSTASPGDVYVYLTGEIADPAVLAAVKTANEDVSRKGGDLFARNPDGTLTARDSAIDVARAAVGIDFARRSVTRTTGVTLTDRNGDGLPDTPRQARTLFTYSIAHGVPSDTSTFVYTKDQVARLLQPLGRGGFATVLRYPLQGFPDTSKVKQARRTVEASALGLTQSATSHGRSVEARVSGDIVAEQITLDAVTNAMVISVPLAMLLCFAVAAFAMRSLRLAAVSIVPIALVIVWLLAFMAAFDYHINVITATIAAISVGVGIDFSTHYTMRYRERLRAMSSRAEAVRSAAEGTGTALLLSGITSIVGFGILALAPMPIFAAYGLLTAVMIALSLAATLVVLPSLLFVLGPRPAAETSPELGSVAEAETT
ncbi:MAG TPA: MMPL family transporter [Gaiellaceae bacterium]|nr:MMPL family transporter [Gaiellaceae bacterium]